MIKNKPKQDEHKKTMAFNKKTFRHYDKYNPEERIIDKLQFEEKKAFLSLKSKINESFPYKESSIIKRKVFNIINKIMKKDPYKNFNEDYAQFFDTLVDFLSSSKNPMKAMNNLNTIINNIINGTPSKFLFVSFEALEELMKKPIFKNNEEKMYKILYYTSKNKNININILLNRINNLLSAPKLIDYIYYTTKNTKDKNMLYSLYLLDAINKNQEVELEDIRINELINITKTLTKEKNKNLLIIFHKFLLYNKNANNMDIALQLLPYLKNIIKLIESKFIGDVSTDLYIIQFLKHENNPERLIKKLIIYEKALKSFEEINYKNRMYEAYKIDHFAYESAMHICLKYSKSEIEKLDIKELIANQNRKYKHMIIKFLDKSMKTLFTSNSLALYTKIIDTLNKPLKIEQETPSEIAKAILRELLDDNLYKFFSKKHELGKAKNWNKGYKLRRLDSIISMPKNARGIVNNLLTSLNENDKKIMIKLCTTLYENKQKSFLKALNNIDTSGDIFYEITKKAFGEKFKESLKVIRELLTKNDDLAEKVIIWLPVLEDKKHINLFKSFLNAYINGDYKYLRYKSFPNYDFWIKNCEINAGSITLKDNRYEIERKLNKILEDIKKFVTISNDKALKKELNDILSLESESIINEKDPKELKKYIEKLISKIDRSKILGLSNKDPKSKMLIKKFDSIKTLITDYSYDKPLTFVFTDDFELLFNMGKSRYIDTCQSYDWPREEKLGLLGAIANPWVKMFAILDGKEIVGRVKVYFVIKKVGDKKKKGIIIDKYYGLPGGKVLLFKHMKNLLNKWIEEGKIDFYDTQVTDYINPISKRIAPVYSDIPSFEKLFKD